MPGPGWLILIPNVLTVLRLALTVTFIVVDPKWWGFIILAAALSDYADGVIARQFNLTSWIGALLDAIADKAFTITVIVTYILTGRLEWWQALLLVARDVVVAFVAFFAAAVRDWTSFKRMSSRYYGKITTAVIFALLLVIAFWPGNHTASITLIVLASACSVVAAIDYAMQFVVEYKSWKGRTNKST